MCGPEDPLFTPLLPLAKGPISSKRVSSQDPLLRKFGNLSLNSLNFHPNFSSQAPKFGNFQLTSPQIWKFSAHKPPNLEIFCSQAPLFRGECQFASPTLRKSGPLPEKKLSAPPPRALSILPMLSVVSFRSVSTVLMPPMFPFLTMMLPPLYLSSVALKLNPLSTT